MRRRQLLAAAAGAALTGCAAPQLSDYQAEKPELDLRTYFDGEVRAWGLFADRAGRVVKRFTVRMDCSWKGDEGVLDEAFLFSDGTRQRRVWRLTRQAQGRYTGSADDVVGPAQGQQMGNAFRWTYTLALPVDGRTWHVQMDDWMFRISDKVVLNKAVMRKFGIRVGEVILSFEKP